MVAAVLCGITDLDQVAALRLRHGPQVDVEPVAGRPAAGGVPGRRRSAAGRRPRASSRAATRPATRSPAGSRRSGRRKLGLRAGIPIPVGAFDAHWDAIGAGVREGDVVNVVGTSTCIMAIARETRLIPGVCGVVQGSIHPQMAGIEAGLSATGDIFEAIARRAGTTVAALSQGLEAYRAGQTGLLRLTWDNGDRTVLVNPELGGVTLGWKLTHTAQDELFAAIEGTAFHTRVILERMEEHGVPIRRVINGGGIPQKNEVLNRVYANVLNKPVLVPTSEVTSLGSAIFAFLAAGALSARSKKRRTRSAPATAPSSRIPPRRRSTSSSTRSTGSCTSAWAAPRRLRSPPATFCLSYAPSRPGCSLPEPVRRVMPPPHPPRGVLCTNGDSDAWPTAGPRSR